MIAEQIKKLVHYQKHTWEDYVRLHNIGRFRYNGVGEYLVNDARGNVVYDGNNRDEAVAVFLSLPRVCETLDAFQTL